MANTSSAKKANRQTLRRTEVNKARKSRMRTYVRKAEEALKAGDKTAAATAVREAQPELMKAAKTGVIHRNAASRKVSRLTAALKRLGA